jgi:hypothetical protein
MPGRMRIERIEPRGSAGSGESVPDCEAQIQVVR